MKSLAYILIIFTIIFSSGCFYSVPEEFESGSIGGITQGKDLRGIPEVQVTVVGTEKVVFTDDTGTFFFGELEPATYMLSFYKEGYPTQKKNITIQKGQSRTVIVEMLPGTSDIDTNPNDFPNNNLDTGGDVYLLYVANAGPKPEENPENNNPWNTGNNPSINPPGTDGGGGIQEEYLMFYGYDPVRDAYKGFDPNIKIEDIMKSIHYYDKKRNNLSVINTAYKGPVSIYEWASTVRPFWVDMSDNGLLYIADSSNNISVFNTSGNDFYSTTIFLGEYILCDIALGNSDSRLFCALGSPGDPVVGVIDTTTNSYLKTIPLPRLKDGSIGQPWGVAAHKTGSRAYVTLGTATGGEVVFINTLSNSIERTVKVGPNPFGLAVTPDGKKLYVANNNSNTVSVVDTFTGDVVNTVEVGLNPIRVAISPDGKKAIVTNKGSNSVSIIDTAMDSVLNNLPAGKAPVGVAVSGDGKMAFVANSGSHDIAMIDLSRNAVTGRTTPFEGGSPFDIAVK